MMGREINYWQSLIVEMFQPKEPRATNFGFSPYTIVPKPELNLLFSIH